MTTITSEVECGVIECDNEACSEFGKKIVLTPGAGALACRCNRVYKPEYSVVLRWFPVSLPHDEIGCD